jgi:hypothetical protein
VNVALGSAKGESAVVWSGDLNIPPDQVILWSIIAFFAGVLMIASAALYIVCCLIRERVLMPHIALCGGIIILIAWLAVMGHAAHLYAKWSALKGMTMQVGILNFIHNFSGMEAVTIATLVAWLIVIALGLLASMRKAA